MATAHRRTAAHGRAPAGARGGVLRLGIRARRAFVGRVACLALCGSPSRRRGVARASLRTEHQRTLNGHFRNRTGATKIKMRSRDPACGAPPRRGLARGCQSLYIDARLSRTPHGLRLGRKRKGRYALHRVPCGDRHRAAGVPLALPGLPRRPPRVGSPARQRWQTRNAQFEFLAPIMWGCIFAFGLIYMSMHYRWLTLYPPHLSPDQVMYRGGSS